MELSEGAVVAIQKTAREAEQNLRAVSFLDTPDPRTKLLVQGDKQTAFAVPAEFRSHQARTLASFIAYAETTQNKGVIWYVAEKVVLLIDDSDRRDRVEFRLTFSSAWAMLRELDEKRQPLTQRDLIRLLKNYLGVSAATVTLFRKLDFATQIRTGGEIQKSKESLGNSITAEVACTHDLPDELIVTVPIYQTPGEKDTYTVRLLLEYDAQACRILVTPEPDLLQDLVDRHQTTIRERLEAELADQLPIYYGAP